MLIVFEKLRFQNVFCAHENKKPAFSNSFVFVNGLVWTASVTVDIISISKSSGVVWRGCLRLAHDQNTLDHNLVSSFDWMSLVWSSGTLFGS